MLTYSTKFMQERVDFLTGSGMPLENVAKAIVSHPQVNICLILLSSRMTLQGCLPSMLM